MWPVSSVHASIFLNCASKVSCGGWEGGKWDREGWKFDETWKIMSNILCIFLKCDGELYDFRNVEMHLHKSRLYSEYCTCCVTSADVCGCESTTFFQYFNNQNYSVQTHFSVWLKSLFSFGSVDLKSAKLFTSWYCYERQTCSVWNSIFLFMNEGKTNKVCWSHILSFHFDGKVSEIEFDSKILFLLKIQLHFYYQSMSRDWWWLTNLFEIKAQYKNGKKSPKFHILHESYFPSPHI